MRPKIGGAVRNIPVDWNDIINVLIQQPVFFFSRLTWESAFLNWELHHNLHKFACEKLLKTLKSQPNRQKQINQYPSHKTRYNIKEQTERLPDEERGIGGETTTQGT